MRRGRAGTPRTAFLAVPLEPPALAACGRLLTALREALPAVRWVRPEGLHLTVAFLGRLPVDLHPAATAAAAPLASRATPFAVELGGLGAFPDRGDPSVLWLGVRAGAEALGALAAGLVTALRGGGLPAEDRPYRAHCTLGRSRPGWGAEQRRAWEELRGRGAPLPAFEARRLVLFESHPAAGGSRYLPLAELGFQG